MALEWINDPDRIKEIDLCVHGISKGLKGSLTSQPPRSHTCTTPPCTTVRTVSTFSVETKTNAPCDSELAKLLPAVIRSDTKLITVYNSTVSGRGVHVGRFTWSGGGITMKGLMSGTTNAGILRIPEFQGCERCIAPRILIGELTAKIALATTAPAALRPLKNAEILAVYRLAVGTNGAAKGTLEGALTIRCA